MLQLYKIQIRRVSLGQPIGQSIACDCYVVCSQLAIQSIMLEQHLMTTCMSTSGSWLACWPQNTNLFFNPHTHVSCTYRKLPKICPPFLHTTFRQKWVRGICSNIQFSHAYAPSIRSPYSCICTQSQQSQWLPRLSERAATSQNVYYRKSAAFALILSQEVPKQPASSVVMGDNST